MQYNIKYINEIVGGTFLRFRGDDRVEHLLLDSRRLIFPDTSLFFALRGPRRDGRVFMEELYRRGVRNFVVQKKTPEEKTPEEEADPRSARKGALSSAEADLRSDGQSAWDIARYDVFTDANILLVEDTLAALQQLAASHRRQFAIPVIGITGSNGKTIVKEWLNQLLEDEYHIVRSPKSYNSQTGVPLSVWQLQTGHELAIFEAGISRREEMRKLETIIRPTIGIFTNIGEAHSEGFKSRGEKAAEKLGLFVDVEVLIYCNDQPETVRAVNDWMVGRERVAGVAGADHPSLFAWGHEAGASVRIDSIEKKEGQTTIRGS
jgi:Alr-MurF fusion protein